MKKTRSVLLAALLLASCIGVVLMSGAGAASPLTPTVIYTAGACTDEGYEHFNTVDLALVKANENNRKWKSDDVLEIRFDGSFVAGGHNGILFSATTVWREDNTKLPIIIRGESRESSVIDFDNAGGFYACANDYTFADCSLMIGNDGTQFFAGSGDVTFENCALSVTTSSRVEIQDKTKQAQLIEISKDAAEWVCTENGVDVIPALEAWTSVISDSTSPFYDETLGYTLRAMASTGTLYGDWTHDGDVGGGQYLNACIVFEVITKRSCVGNTFVPDYTLRSGTWRDLQELAHKTVVATYGEDYFNTPASAGDDEKFNILFPGSSTCYYFADELASLGYHAGLNMKVVNPYISSLRINPQWNNYIQPENAGYAERIWIDSGNGAVLTSKGSQTLQEIIPRDTWDAVFIYSGTSGFDDYFSRFTEDYLSEEDYPEYMKLIYADLVHAADTYEFLRENCGGARMLWYSAPVGPVGAFGSTTELKGYVFADNCYDGVYAGWNEDALKNVSSSITFGDNVQYICPKNKASIHVAASGYRLGETSTALTDATAKNVKFIASGMDGIPEVLPVDTEATLYINGENAAVYNIAAKIGGSPCDSTVWLKKGSVQRITGDNYLDSASDGPIEQFYGDMTLKVTGGNLASSVAATWDSDVRGDLEIYVSPDDGDITGITMVRGAFGNGNKQGGFSGNVTTTIKNVEVSGSAHLGGGRGNVVNTIENASFDGYFIGARIAGPKSITNNLTNVTFAGEDSGYKASIMGTYGTMLYGDVTNNLTSVTFPSAYYGGNSSGIVQGNITNNLTGCTVKGKYVGGNRKSVIHGSVINNITGGHYGQGDGATFLSAYLGMESSSDRMDTIGGQIKNTLDGATFYGTYLYAGNCYGTFADNANVECRIENTVKGITAQRFIGSSVYADLTNGKVKTVIQGVNEVTYFYAIANSRQVLEGETRLQGTVNGGLYMSSNGGKVTKQTNYIEKGALQTSSDYNVYGATNIGGTVSDLTTYVTGGEIYRFYGASRDGNASGTVKTYLQGGKINYFYGGNDKGTFTGNITTTVEGSANVPNFYGGSLSGTILGNVENVFKSGTVSVFYGAGYGGSIGRKDDASTTDVNEAVIGNVTNTVSGSGITKFRGGAYKGASVYGTVKNVLKDATFPESACGGSMEGHADYIVNELTNVTISGYYYGSYNGTAGTVTTTVHSGSYTGVYGGPKEGTCSGTDITFLGGTFSGGIYGGGDSASTINGKIKVSVNGVTVKTYAILAGKGIINQPADFDGEYLVESQIFGGSFKGVWGGGEGSSKKIGGSIKTTVYGGTFNNYNSDYNRLSAFNAGNRNMVHTAGNAVAYIYGGTFNGEVIAGSCPNDEKTGVQANKGTASITIYGGTFNKPILANSKWGSYALGKVILNPTESDIIINSTMAPRTDTTAAQSYEIVGGDRKIILGADASVKANSATGTVKLGQAEAWKKQTYVTMPEGNDAVVTVTGPHCLDKAGDSVVAVKGGVQLFGATMLLTDRVAVRALFDKASVDENADFTFSFMMDGKALASGSKADLVPYGEDYYCTVLAKIGANDFTKTVTFAGSEMVWENSFSVKGLAELAEDAWAGNEVDVQLAKAMQNFAAIVAGQALPYGDLQPDLTKLDGFKASASKEDGTAFTVTAKGLVMGNAVGIRIYGTSAEAITADSFVIKVNGKDVTEKAIVSAGEKAGEYTVDLYVNAKNMSDPLNLVITEKATNKVCLNLTDRVDAIAASYGENHENYAKAQQLLVYIQAAVAYAGK